MSDERQLRNTDFIFDVNQIELVDSVIDTLIDCGHDPDEITRLDLLDVLATLGLMLTPDVEQHAAAAYLSLLGGLGARELEG